jgi:tetratricopeptide (TPR) repeat protein
MNVSRLDVLRQSLKQNPGDEFTRYLVALELVKLNQMAEAFTHFEILAQKHPDYLPTYYQYAVALQKEGRIDRAREVFQMGIKVAEKAGDGHAKSELLQALNEIEG